MFTMDGQINQGLVLAQQLLAHRRMKAVLLKKQQLFCLRLLHPKQTHVTQKSLGLQKLNKDFQTPHE